jgi:transposase
MRYYGIDLHSDSMTVAVQELVDRVWRTRTYGCLLFGPEFGRFLGGLCQNDVILVEATTVSFWFYDQVIERVQACNILNTHKLDSYRNKTDKIDAKRLVKILAYNEQMEPDLQKRPYIYVPSKAVRDLRALFTTYSLTKKMITQFETLDAEKTQLHDLICYQGVQLFGEEIKLLLGIKGFSCLTSTALMTDIVCVDRFASAKKFCSYLRTAPRISASNHTVHLGRVNKQGRALTCTLLTQSVTHLTKVPHFGEFKERIKGGKKSCTVRMALIRKVLVSAYYMLSRNQPFRWIDPISYERKLKKMNRIVKKYSRGESARVQAA